MLPSHSMKMMAFHLIIGGEIGRPLRWCGKTTRGSLQCASPMVQNYADRLHGNSQFGCGRQENIGKFGLMDILWSFIGKPYPSREIEYSTATRAPVQIGA